MMSNIVSRVLCFVLLVTIFSVGALQALAASVVSTALADINNNAITEIREDNAKYTVVVSNAGGNKLMVIMVLKDVNGNVLGIKINKFSPGSNNNYEASVQMEGLWQKVDNFVECLVWDESLKSLTAKKTLRFEKVAISSSNTVGMQDALYLTANITGTNNPSPKVTWSVEDIDGVASVSGNVLTPVSMGKVKVTATALDDPTKFDEMLVTITDVAYDNNITEVKVTNDGIVEMGKSLYLTADVSGPGRPLKDVTWSVTAGTGSATIAGNILTPVSEGTVTVKATSVGDPTKFGTLVITVLPAQVWVSQGTGVVTSTPTQTVITKFNPAGTLDDAANPYPPVAKYTLPSALTTNTHSVTAEYTLLGEWMDFARVAFTFNSYLSNPPSFVKHDGKISFNWSDSTIILDKTKWYKVVIILNPSKAAYNASSMSFSWTVTEVASGTVVFSGTKTPAANEIVSVIPETITSVNWAQRIMTSPLPADSTWKLTFKDFKITQQ